MGPKTISKAIDTIQFQFKITGVHANLC